MCGDCIVMQESHSLDSYQFSCKAAIHICQSAWNKGWALCGNYLAKRNESMSANMLELYGSCLYFFFKSSFACKMPAVTRTPSFFPFFIHHLLCISQEQRSLVPSCSANTCRAAHFLNMFVYKSMPLYISMIIITL